MTQTEGGGEEREVEKTKFRMDQQSFILKGDKHGTLNRNAWISIS